MFRYALLLAALAFHGCAPLPSGEGDTTAEPVSLAQQTFQVNEALRAFEKACLSATPSQEVARQAAAQEGIQFNPARGSPVKTRLSFDGDATSYTCRVSGRTEWDSVAIPFVEAALARRGFTLSSGFERSSFSGPLSRGEEDNFQTVATASRNGQNFAIVVDQRASNRTRRGRLIRVTVARTTVIIATADRVP